MSNLAKSVVGLMLLIAAAACARPARPPVGVQGVQGRPGAEASPLALPMLIHTVDKVPPVVVPSPDVAEYRYAELNVPLVNKLETGSRVRLQLFTMKELILRVEQRLRRPYGQTIVGTLEGLAGDAIINETKTGFMVILRLSSAGDIEIGNCDGNMCIAKQFKRNLERRQCAARSSGPIVMAAGRRQALDPALVDVLVLYTDEIARRLQWQTEGDAYTAIGTWIDDTNRALVCSDVRAQLRLVRVAQVAYTETGNVQTDLQNWVNPANTEAQDLAQRRAAIGADLVSVIVDEPNAADFGYAKIFSNDPTYHMRAVNVVQGDLLTSRIVLAHELGHNFGAGHDLGSLDPNGYLPDSHAGFMLFGSSDLRGTVLAGIGQPVPRYSNPDRCYVPASSPYDALPTGEKDVADNARTLNATAATVAAFRPPLFDGVWDLMRPCETQIACPR